MTARERLAVSSWSLHRLLGTTHPHDLSSDAIGPVQETYGPGEASLLDLPALVASRGLRRLEICSFHLPARDSAYLGELKRALADAGVRLQTLLIEAGDLSDPATAKRDAAWISGWVEVAEELGADNARIIAGKQRPSAEAIALSAQGLASIADSHAGSSVRLVTENWFDLLSTPEDVYRLLDACEGRIGLNADFGNWKGPGKFDALGEIFGLATLCHAKASFSGGVMDGQDFGRCVDVAEAAGYAGPYTLIFDNDEPGEWQGLAIEGGFIAERLAALAA